MNEPRLVGMPMVKDLFQSEVVKKALATPTEFGWRLRFWIGTSKTSFSTIGIRKARGGERFFQSLDSIYEQLVKLGCQTLEVQVRQRSIGLAEPPLPRGAMEGGRRISPEIDRLTQLEEKNRKSHLTRTERDEMKHLQKKYHWNK